jgi:hypothetical protein
MSRVGDGERDLSLDEGLSKPLTAIRAGLSSKLGRSFSMTFVLKSYDQRGNPSNWRTYHGTGDGASGMGLAGGVDPALGLLMEKFFGSGPGLRFRGSRAPTSVLGLGLLLFLLAPGEATRSMSASSTIILLSILNGLPNMC